MKRGFYTIMAAQFFSSLADNALLIAAIALLNQLGGAAWLVPLLKALLHVPYVMLAPFVGPFADAWPKGKVMFYTNTIKVIGCLVMLCYATVASIGAQSTSPGARTQASNKSPRATPLTRSQIACSAPSGTGTFVAPKFSHR